jgi:O-6-methylguanine DNA methyltransferase
MKRSAYCVFETPLGWCGIAWSDAGPSRATPAVSGFQLPEATAKLTEACIARIPGARHVRTPPPAIAAVIRRVNRHFRGDVQDFRDVAVYLDGVGAFERRVYEAARMIPAGETRTYGELAKALGARDAARAVGQALGKNPIALIVPCHRVLAAGGKPGGFSAHGGRATKARMLAAEGVALETPRVIKTVRDVQRAAALLKTLDRKLATCFGKPLSFRAQRAQPPYATLAEAIVRQQLSRAVAVAILGRVYALYSGAAMPEPEKILATPDRMLRGAGLSRVKTKAFKDLAAKTLDGTVPSLEKIVALTDDEIVRRLTSIYGVGRWTVEMLLIFNLGRMDVLPVDDFAIRRGVSLVYGMKQPPTPAKVLALGEAWRPHRTVASLYLWNFLNP